MQILFDYQIMFLFVTIFISIFVGVYLIMIWHRQEQRLLSDLPFVFGVTFIAHAVNNLIRLLPIITSIGMTLDLFKIRTVVILATVLPILAALLQIWWPRGQKLHARTLFAIGLYWALVVILSPSAEMILLLCVPLVLVTTVTLAATFTITWKTKRLREVRSDLMVVSLIFASIGQIIATDLILNSIFNAASTIVAGLALVNPWRRHSRSQQRPETVKMSKDTPVISSNVEGLS
ncbi:MAG: hypothetical protein K9W43_08435 [Candidatus Thorarchaeota archaeon]|nr:hypothetical protein [Candidatus Thorarchaeota archaeon]